MADDYDDHDFVDDGTDMHLCAWRDGEADCGDAADSQSHRNDPSVITTPLGEILEMEPFHKVVMIGKHRDGPVWVEITWDGTGLSLSGVIGPMLNGDARGSCGQIASYLAESVTDGWEPERIDSLREVWEDWHLNTMRAGCEHQRADGWNKRPIDPDKPLTAYGRHFDGQSQPTWNMLAWVRENEHSDGLLMRSCEVCGYQYGSAWLTEEVPDDVLEFLRDLPESDSVCPWPSMRERHG